MRDRVSLNNKLKEVCSNVYFTPPDGARLQYPCIIYERDYPSYDRANNHVYRIDMGYKISVISRNDNEGMIQQMLTKFQSISFTQEFKSEGLYHTIFTLYW